MDKKAPVIFKNTFSYKLIYIFAIPDDAHAGCLKIGDTTVSTNLQPDRLPPNCHELNQAAQERIKKYTNTAAVTVQLLHTELALVTKQKNGKFYTESFRDYKVHRVLENSGFKKKIFENNTGNEWFCTDIDTAKEAISAVKNQMTSLDTAKSSEEFIPIVFRPEQKEAIAKTVERFKKSPRMLWNAKMRFGKTLSALEVVKRCKFKKTILITHRPVVDDGWHEDFFKIFTKEDNYAYGSKKIDSTIKNLERDFTEKRKNYIYFASIQDLRGSKEAGGKFDKNNDVFSVKWDLVIIDEAHEGTTTKLGDDVKSLLFKEKDGTKLLELSGTPFNILDNYEDENSVYTWDYVMEQKAKQEWEETHFGDSNPYADLPEMNMYTYDLGKLLHSKYEDFEDKAFNFTEFFRTNEAGLFVHESDVKSFLNLLTDKNSESLYPFSTEEYRKLFRHSLWMIPGVKEALALQKLLENHPVFSGFEIVNVAGNGDPDDPTGEALQAVRTAIDNADEDGYTITLSCGKLTTGVSVPEWTAVFMLSGSYSTKASGYLQTIFRVQTPCCRYGKVKTECYVFDFAPDRTLKMVADSVTLCAKAGKTKSDDKIRLGEFLNFCPVIAIDGSRMKSFEVNSLLQKLKSAYAERAVTKGFDDSSLYNDELLKLTEVELKQFRDLQAIIGETKANSAGNKIDVNAQRLTKEEYESLERGTQQKEKRELSPEEEAVRQKLLEAKKTRQSAISILRGISIRMPLLIYGANVDVSEEINLEKFIALVDENSWEEFMPRGVTKEKFREFIKYYDEDVFIAAGNRIRNLVLNADKLSVTERVRKIAEIFSYFRNPDKETVLTPWRVVNMHLGDCLGGYSFFDKDYEKPLLENEVPHFIEIEGVTEKTLGNKDAKILEINSKTGLYPLYCAYSIFRAKKESNPDKTDAELWNETIEENIFVICKTPMAKAITSRTLSGYGKTKINAHAFDHLVNDLKNKSEQFVKDVTSKNFWKKGNGTMEFDAVVGNPPYQSETGGSGRQATPIYNLFFNASKKLTPHFISMIMPSRWYAGGKGLDKFRENMLKNNKLRALFDFPNSEDLFPTVNIAGGLCYYLWVKNYSGECCIKNHDDNTVLNRNLDEFEIFVRNNNAVRIIRKICENKEENLNQFAKANPYFALRNYFSIASYERGKNDDKTGENIILISSQGKGFYTNEKISDRGKILSKYKTIITYAMSGGNKPSSGGNYQIVSSLQVLGKNEVCTETYLVLGAFEAKNEATNLKRYIATKFVRFLLLQALTSIHITRDSFIFVPLQDFTANSDIDWSQNIPKIDEQLYKKYNLSPEEITFIEKMIKPME
ncbi:MAG: Eco57I restriction-modification methylase domain-containing protein [Treponema porcinum]|nr:Eco57I restriction-modification methylase domain-containing protein [Treponema porcinum]